MTSTVVDMRRKAELKFIHKVLQDGPAGHEPVMIPSDFDESYADDKPWYHCFPQTRVRILEQITHWLNHDSRSTNIICLYGAQSVGKTTIARTIAAIAEQQNLLGTVVTSAAYWEGLLKTAPARFSEPTSHRITTLSIAYSLATRDSEYRRLLYHVLEDFDWLDESSTHFINLLLPLSDLNRHHKRLVVLDGEIDLDFLASISQKRLQESIPLLWLIVMQPTQKLWSMLSQQTASCLPIEVPAGGDDETRREIEIYLREGLRKIGENFGEFGIETREMWPAPHAVTKLVEASANLFAYAKNFLELCQPRTLSFTDPGPDPRNRLEKLLCLIDSEHRNNLPPWTVFPFDQDYTDTLAVHNETEGRLLELQLITTVCASSPSLTLFEISLLLGSPLEVIEAAHDWFLHSAFTIVPSPSQASRYTVKLTHSSFLGFFLDTKRSRELSLDPNDIYPLLMRACLTAIEQKRFFSNPQTLLLRVNALYYVTMFAVQNIWDISCKIPDESVFVNLAIKIMAMLDILRYLSGRIPVVPFVKFLRRVQSAKTQLPTPQPHMVRTAPLTWVDQELIDVCETIAEPMDFDLLQRQPPADHALPHGIAFYALIGHPKEPSLALLTNEQVDIYMRKDLIHGDIPTFIGSNPIFDYDHLYEEI
ncbi:hypothetical protein D9756_009719 [Leucocoprinus leucothites]|uniref:Orc1-like AAA ATPase domain-containing protein n=1 Tax=Leucocoprinus leucothites TaxID=201217 RepID=A0A8H5FT82_9AGAR|nr:hypothetical protein D9756_009719 [Leucoagaricus leucothites]